MISKSRYLNGLLIGLMLSSISAWAEPKTFDCMIEANQLIEIRSPVAGLLESVPAQRGAAVKKGDVIVSLEA